MTHSRFGVEKQKMAAKNQDGGRKFLILLTRKLESGLRNSHAKNGAWFHSVTGPTITDCTTLGPSRQTFYYHFFIIIYYYLLLFIIITNFAQIIKQNKINNILIRIKNIREIDNFLNMGQLTHLVFLGIHMHTRQNCLSIFLFNIKSHK